MFSIGLDNCKNPVNLGAAIRAVACFDGQTVHFSGKRMTPKLAAVGHNTSVPVFHHEDVMQGIPQMHVPIAVELVDGAYDLPAFRHPMHAYYIFGAEDNTLGKRILNRCQWVIKIPSRHCLNLAACVNVVLYDRVAKQSKECHEYSS
jgi:tRNA(Leu) C34 or U34 (ribose-2'-O)-methylase TrmL